MKYLGISGGKIIEGFSILPYINVNWMTLSDGRYYDIQFGLFRWYFTIGQIKKKLKEDGYY